MDTSAQIKKYIATGEPDKAIKLLLEYAKKHRPGIYDEALLLSGQYRQWKREITLGVQQTNNELRRIEVGIIDVLNDEETFEGNSSKANRLAATPKNTSPAPQKSNLTSVLLGVFGTISIGFILLMAIGEDDTAVLAENNSKNAPTSHPQETKAVPAQPEETVFGGGLTKGQFDHMINAYKEDTGKNRLDINTVIQVRYTSGAKSGVFESVANSKEWVERTEGSNEILFRYEEISRDNNVITIHDNKLKRTRFLSIEDDKIHEQVEGFPKFHIFNIIGVY